MKKKLMSEERKDFRPTKDEISVTKIFNQHGLHWGTLFKIAWDLFREGHINDSSLMFMVANKVTTHENIKFDLCLASEEALMKRSDSPRIDHLVENLFKRLDEIEKREREDKETNSDLKQGEQVEAEVDTGLYQFTEIDDNFETLTTTVVEIKEGDLIQIGGNEFKVTQKNGMRVHLAHGQCILSYAGNRKIKVKRPVSTVTYGSDLKVAGGFYECNGVACTCVVRDGRKVLVKIPTKPTDTENDIVEVVVANKFYKNLQLVRVR